MDLLHLYKLFYMIKNLINTLHIKTPKSNPKNPQVPS